MKRSVSTALVATSFLALYGGDCSDGIDRGLVDDNRETDGIETDLIDAAAVIEAHDRAWSQRSYAAYDALLDEEFEFFPLPEDVSNFPWMTSDSWGRATELGMAFDMFDPNYPQGSGAVDLIEMNATPVESQVLGDGSIESICSAIGRVMWTAADGAAFDTWLRFTFVEREGYLRIREIRELEDAGRQDYPGGIGYHSWGRIKASF